jgi:hypothetical protein
MVKHLTHKYKIKGSNLATITWRQKTQQKLTYLSGTVVDHMTCKPKIKGLNPATANKRKNRTEKVWQKMVVP